MGKKIKEMPEGFREFAMAIAVANGHSHPDHYADCVTAAYAGSALPPHPTDTPDEPEEKPEEDGEKQG